MTVDLKKMRLISILWGLVLFGIVLVLTIFGFIYKKESQEYKEFENLIEEKAREYVEKNGIDVDSNFKITLTTLKEEGYILTSFVKEEDCEGYVEVSSKKNLEKYDAFISCKKYKTRGYKRS